MCSKCLFRKGVSPCAYMRAKQAAARAQRISEDEIAIEEFLVKVRGLLAETYARVDGQQSLRERSTHAIVTLGGQPKGHSSTRKRTKT